jgi:hypothetical protein
MVLEGRVEKSGTFSQVLERKDASLLKFDITIFAAESYADEHWVRDPEGIPHYQCFLFQLLISPITGNLNPGFTELFVIKVDLSELQDKLVEKKDESSGETYYTLDYVVETIFDSLNLEGNIIYEVRTLNPFLYYPTD